MTKPIAITLGDPAGIGPEIIVKAFRDAPDVTRACFVVGDVATVRRAVKQVCGGELPIPVAELTSADQVADTPPRCLPVLQVGTLEAPVTLGCLSASAGRLAADCVVWAAKAALRGEVAALVTAPLNKEALALAGEPYETYPGHTELLQALAASHFGQDLSQMPVRMMLANDELRVVLVSIHMSLLQAIEAVTIDNLLETLRIADQSLRAVLGRQPHIGVAGLNPHAGEGGLFGDEEIHIISPAIDMARKQGLLVTGPIAPDTVFMRARATPKHLGEFDAVIAMYHDQGLIPVKYLGIEKGVNVTLGLPLVRTSPDHGTAFDIAGTGRADPASLLAAIRMARQLSQRGCT